MSTEENKALSRRVIEELINEQKPALADELIDTNFVDHGIAGKGFKGPEGFKQYVTTLITAFPDLRLTIDDMVAEGDRVVMRLTARDTHNGDFMGIAPTGKKIAVQAMGIDRFAGGKAVELWLSIDGAGILQQLGIVPPRR